MKRIISLFTVLMLICSVLVIPANASDSDLSYGYDTDLYSESENVSGRVLDYAEVLTQDEAVDLRAKLNDIFDRHQCDVVVMTMNSLYGYTATELADAYSETFSGDCILFFMALEEREWAISTTGYCITAFTDAGQEHLTSLFMDDLSDGYYASAFDKYADACDDFLTQAENGEPYDVDNIPGEKPSVSPLWILGSLVIGFVIALLPMKRLRDEIKNVKFQDAAADYVKKNSMNVSQSRDRFLYTHTDRRARPKNNGGSSTHTSSSGTTHGGSSGKF